MFANVIIDISHESVDKPFSYRIPEKLENRIEVGSAVKVPFGRGDTLRSGYVIGLSESCNYDPAKVKEIAGISTENLPAEALYVQLAAWIRRTYGGTMIRAMQTVLPQHKKKKILQHRSIVLRMPEREATELYYECISKKYVAKARLLKELLEEPDHRLPYGLVTGKLGVSAAVIRGMSTKGVVKLESEDFLRNPVKMISTAGNAHDLSEEQQAAVNAVTTDLEQGRPGTYLLYGITGSGKTEVYIAMIEAVVAQGKQAIMLIPEIALTYQTLMRFYRHFGDRVSVMNSSLSEGEKYDQFERARRGEIDVIIGPRSALFTPFPNLGIIIMDEEHESSYKSESMPKYHARETAVKLAELVTKRQQELSMEGQQEQGQELPMDRQQEQEAATSKQQEQKNAGVSVVLGSATPSLEAFYRAQTGEYHLLQLTKRLTGGTLPEVEVADLRKELKEGNRSVFSRSLQQYMEENLEKGEQTMLFLNRRGIAGFVSCRECGHVFKCPHCDVPMSSHGGNRLVCHYCGHEETAPALCPECGSKYIMSMRAGTEQIEAQVKKLFPRARVLRMDADTTTKKDSYEKILSAFAAHEADILVGTQMIVKGHDFPDVTLVGIVAADMSLNSSDYRAAERTFQLLTQAAGRAGRGEKPGRVVIQTYQPEHYSIVTAKAQDYNAFYDEEIAYRELLMYPPVAHMMGIQITADREKDAAAFAGSVKEGLTGMHLKDVILIGPAPANITRISDRYRYAIYAKSKNYDDLVQMKDRSENYLQRLKDIGRYVDLQMQFDFDPMSGF